MDVQEGHFKKRAEKNDAVIKMPCVSVYLSRKEWEDACWQLISNSPEFLNRFMTSHERRNIILRVAVVHRLGEGMSYRNIGRELWLSPQTISVIKKGISEKGYRGYKTRGERKKKVYSANRNRKKIRAVARRKTKYGTPFKDILEVL